MMSLDYKEGWRDARTEIEAIIVNQMALIASGTTGLLYPDVHFHALATLRQELFDCPFTSLASLPPGRSRAEYALILEDEHHA